MVGSSNFHNLIAPALAALLRAHLLGTVCRVFIADMKVRVGNIFYYPDLLGSCGKHKTIALLEQSDETVTKPGSLRPTPVSL